MNAFLHLLVKIDPHHHTLKKLRIPVFMHACMHLYSSVASDPGLSLPGMISIHCVMLCSIFHKTGLHWGCVRGIYYRVPLAPTLRQPRSRNFLPQLGCSRQALVRLWVLWHRDCIPHPLYHAWLLLQRRLGCTCSFEPSHISTPALGSCSASKEQASLLPC